MGKPVEDDRGIEAKIEPGKEGHGIGVHFPFIEGAKPGKRLPTDENIRRHGKVGNEVQFLVDDAYAGIARLG